MGHDCVDTAFVPQLNVPELTLSSLSLRQATPEAMTLWLEQVPKADLVSLSRELRQFLPQLNRLRINGAKRFKLLEQLRPLTHYCLNQLDLRAQSRSLELNAEQRQAANMAQLLQNHLAIGYKHVLLEALTHQAPHLSTLALHRSLTELSFCLLRASSLYCPPPPGLWQELHQLFQLAKARQLQNQQVADLPNPESGRLTIVQLYKRALLFALSHNGHLRQSEQKQIFIACGRWSNEVQLSPDQALTEGGFVLQLDSDRPPQHRHVVAQADARHQTRWRLDSYCLCAKLRHAPRRQNALLARPLADHLIAHLAKVWGTLPARHSERSLSSGTLQLSSGFCASHYFLAGELNFDPWLDLQGLDWRARYKNQLQHGAAWDQAFDVEKQDDNEAVGVSFFRHTHESGQPAEEEQREPFALFQAQLIDSSAGGCRIELQGQMPPRLLAGELIAVRDSEYGDRKGCHWNLAMIRWLKRRGSQNVQAGLQLLPAGVRLGAITVRNHEGEYSHYMRCFILPSPSGSEGADSGASTLLMPRIQFTDHARVELVDRGKALAGQISLEHQPASGFLQVHFEPEEQYSRYQQGLELDMSY